MQFFKILVFLISLPVAGSALSAEAPKANVHQIMLTKVNPQSLAFWDITNNAMDDRGDVAASKLKAADWVRLLTIGKALEEAGRLLATTSGVRAAAPGAKLQDEGSAGGSKVADVQRYLDAKPAVFRTHALALQKTGADVVAAAERRDVKQLSALSGRLDEVCEDCHAIFWYPNQKR